MKRQTPIQTQKETMSPQMRGLLPRAAVSAKPEYDLPSNGVEETRFGHDFSRVAVRPSAPIGSQDYSNASCPLFPQRCPFGGACHTCPPRVQAKQKIGQTGDKYEQEADRMADYVMRMPEPQRSSSVSDLSPASCAVSRNGTIQLSCSSCSEDEESIQAKTTGGLTPEVTPAISSGIQSLQGGGQPLPPGLRSFMEQRFMNDFGIVRIHADARALLSARSVNALAYTVGQDIVFGKEQYAPETAQGRKLLTHELTHTIQQGANGAPTFRALPSSEFVIQRETSDDDAEKKPVEEKEAGEVLTEGLKTVADEAMDNNPKVKKVIIDPLKDRLKLQWERLSTTDKAVAVGWSVATLGMIGGALLPDPGGRKVLEDVNLATPFTLIPYMPLSSFKYKLPSGDSPEKRLFTFETGFDAGDLINLRTESRGLPKMSFKVNMQWGYDPATERMRILGGDATIGIVPGLSLSAGAYKDVLRPPKTFIGSEGQVTQIKKSIPEFGKPQPIPDVRVMLTVDLMKFKPSDLVQQFKGIF